MADLSVLPKRRPGARFRLIVPLVALLATASLAGCGRTHPPQLHPADPTQVSTAAPGPAAQLAGLATVALDHRFVAGYTYRVSAQPDRTVVVSVATDRSWSVYVPGGALDGGADVATVGSASGIFQCLLGGAMTTAATPPPAAAPATSTTPAVVASPGGAPSVPSGSPAASVSPSPSPGPVYLAPACVRISSSQAPMGGRFTLPTRYVPPIVHAFTDWLTVLSNRSSAILVSTAKAPSGAGSCYSVEPSATSIAPVIDAGIFCFRNDGTLTSITLSGSSVALQDSPAPPPPTMPLPAPVAAGPAAPLSARTR